jgi:hypothetical protein
MRGQSLQPPLSRNSTMTPRWPLTAAAAPPTGRKSAPQHTTKTPTATKRLTTPHEIHGLAAQPANVAAVAAADCDRQCPVAEAGTVSGAASCS